MKVACYLGMASLAVLAAGCMTAYPMMKAPVAGGRALHPADEPILVEQPGIVMTIMVPPREVFTPFAALANRGTGEVPALVGMTQGIQSRVTAAECAVISESDGQEYELLLISPDETAGAAGRAVYCVVLWNQAGIDWHAEIRFDVSWQSAQKPYAKVVYRNTKEDSCLFVENASKEGSWKVAQQMKFGKGAPAKEYAAKARNLNSFPRHKSSQQR